ncbi:MAG TPA: hypothetical protein VN663_05755 [Ramlibacter sp.]|nr:hypothetical protein [Ramlibacter sp.]
MRSAKASIFAVAAGAAAVLAVFAYSGGAAAQGSEMTFFVTSTNPGKGADLGGLAGADQHCQTLASAAGAGGHTWHAYLSTTAAGGGAAINARDRIGKGPWKNAKGVVIAANVDELHGDNKLNKQTALNEKGEVVAGRGDPVNMHDMLTGSTPDGRSSTAAGDTTCGNWTKSGSDGSAIVGHHDRTGLDDSAPAKSWNSSHPSRGCSPEGLKGTGSAGFLYCFAVN